MAPNWPSSVTISTLHWFLNWWKIQEFCIHVYKHHEHILDFFLETFLYLIQLINKRKSFFYQKNISTFLSTPLFFWEMVVKLCYIQKPLIDDIFTNRFWTTKKWHFQHYLCKRYQDYKERISLSSLSNDIHEWCAKKNLCWI